MKPSTGWPLKNANTAGIDWTRSWAASCWFSSTLTFTSRTRPLAALTTFSMIGVSCLHGPHHGAQKSTITGTVRDVSMTSAMKWAVSESLISSPCGACNVLMLAFRFVMGRFVMVRVIAPPAG